MSIPTTYTVSDVRWDTIGPALPSITPFRIGVDGKLALMNRGNGQSFYATYRSRRGAHTSLGFVRAQLPTAEVYEL